MGAGGGVHKSESRGPQRAQIRFSIHQTTISIFYEDNHIYADLIRLAPSLRGFNLINLVAILKLVALLHPPPSHHHIRFYSFQIRTKKKFLVIKLSDLCKTFCFEIRKSTKRHLINQHFPFKRRYLTINSLNVHLSIQNKMTNPLDLDVFLKNQ